jgi:hypothetical protein
MSLNLQLISYNPTDPSHVADIKGGNIGTITEKKVGDDKHTLTITTEKGTFVYASVPEIDEPGQVTDADLQEAMRKFLATGTVSTGELARADIYELVALMVQISMMVKKVNREVRVADIEAQAKETENQAKELRSGALTAMIIGICAGVVQMVGGALQLGAASKAMGAVGKAADATKTAATATTTATTTATATATATATDTVDAVADAAADAAAEAAKYAKIADIALARGQAYSAVAGGAAGALNAGGQYASAAGQAAATEHAAKATKIGAFIEEETAYMRAMQDLARDVLEALKAIQQSQIESAKAIFA